MTRRDFVRQVAVGGVAAARAVAGPGRTLSDSDDRFLDDLQRRCFVYFAERADRGTGLVPDRGCVNGGPYTLDASPTASTSVTGFGLAAYAIAAERGWWTRERAAARARTTLRFLAEQAPQVRGWYYHWLHLSTGERAGAFATGRGPAGVSEVSTIDTALLLAGVLAARECFRDDPAIGAAADAIYRRIDFPWMQVPGSGIIRHGWTPESGFIPYNWDQYSEAGVLYLLALGSPAQPLPGRSWDAWTRNPNVYGDYHYIGTAPIFTHQYSHAFADFRGRRDRTGIDWFANARTATYAHRRFCADLHPRFPGYDERVWGITPSRSADGYIDWGGPPLDPRIDGTVVPAAAAGSLMIAPEICLPALRALADRYGDRIFCRYGFTDSFNPGTGWVSPDVTGLNLGITLLAAENLRSGALWRWFMQAPEIGRALAAAGMAA